MATDLTIKFQENFTSTVETGLSKEIELTNTFKSSTKLLKNKSFLTVDTNFVYNEGNLSIRYILELPIASLVLHSMMFEEYSLEEELSDDLKDACKEFISQVSGALETLINSEAFDDLSSVKFSVEDINSFSETSYTPLGEIYRFDLLIDNNPFDLFIDLSQNSSQFFETLTNMKDDPKLDEIADSTLEEDNDEASQDSLEMNDNEDDVHEIEITPDEPIESIEVPSDIQEDNSSQTKQVDDETSEENLDEKKKKKLKLLIIILGSTITLLIITILTIYFLGLFDEPQIIDENNISKPTKEELIIADIRNKQIDFVPSMIDEKKLNKRLSLLTKYEILEEDIVTKFQKDEKERLYQLKMKRLEAFAKNNKEESLFASTINKEESTKTLQDINNSKVMEELDSKQKEAFLNEKLTFIKIDPIEYKNFKDIIAKEKTRSTSISMCKDTNGKINIYIGPMYLTLEINNIMKTIRKNYPEKKSSVVLNEMLRKDFNTICNF
jgi:flagellar basal body-associated protein FliL